MRRSGADLTPRSELGPHSQIDRRIWRVAGKPLVPPIVNRGSLQGETVAVKDVFHIADQRTGAGVTDFLAESSVNTLHADAVEALLMAGAAVMGICQADQFAFSILGDSNNAPAPNAAVPGAFPGGSTSGAASAVALGEASIALGTDTAGSIRVPASYQGLWGLRTTHGGISRRGMIPLAASFDSVGWLTRTPQLLRRVAVTAFGSHSGFDVDPGLDVPSGFDADLGFDADSGLNVHSGMGTHSGRDPHRVYDSHSSTSPSMSTRFDEALLRDVHPAVAAATLSAVSRLSRETTASESSISESRTLESEPLKDGAVGGRTLEQGISDTGTAGGRTPEHRARLSVTPISLLNLDDFLDAFQVVQAVEAWRTHGRWISAHDQSLSPSVAARFHFGQSISTKQEARARDRLAEVREDFSRQMGNDVLLLSSTSSIAPPLTTDSAELDQVRTATLRLTTIASVVGRPAISFPALIVDGAPVGLSLIGPRNGELGLIDRAVNVRGVLDSELSYSIAHGCERSQENNI